MATQIRGWQTTFVIAWRLTFANGLDVIIAASPLTPELGRDVLGGFTEDYTLVGLLRPYTKWYPFLKAVPVAEDYLRQQLGIDRPLSNLIYTILPLVTRIAPSDDILAAADRWYNQYYQFTQET
jgi:hypothetical protein